MCVRHSIFYVCVTCCDLDVTMRRHYIKSREKARGNNNDLSQVKSKKRKKRKEKKERNSGTSGCGSFVVPYFQPATSTDHLQEDVNIIYYDQTQHANFRDKPVFKLQNNT